MYTAKKVVARPALRGRLFFAEVRLHARCAGWVRPGRRRQSVFGIALLRGIVSGLRVADGRVRIVGRLSNTVATARHLTSPLALGLVDVAVGVQVRGLNGHVGAPGELALVDVTLCHCQQ